MLIPLANECKPVSEAALPRMDRSLAPKTQRAFYRSKLSFEYYQIANILDSFFHDYPSGRDSGHHGRMAERSKALV